MLAGALEVQIFAGMARLVADMAQAKAVVGSTMDSIQKAVAGAKHALELIGVGFAVHEITEKIKSVVEGMAKLQDASEKTGASIENLSKLQFFAGVSGSSIDGVTLALTRLSKGMAGAGVEAAPTSQALKFLGLSAKDAAGNLKDPSALFTEISQKLIQYEDGAGKAAIAQALFGRAGADMLPTLKKMAELGEAEATVTREQAVAAEEYQIEVARLRQQKEALANTIVSALIPTMKDFVEVLLDASKKTDSLGNSAKGLAADHSIEGWADASAMGIARVVDVIKTLVNLVSETSAPFERLFRAAQAGIAGISILLGPGTSEEKFSALKALRQESEQINEELKKRAATGSFWTAKTNTEMSEAVAARIDSRKNLHAFESQMDKDDLAMLDAMFGEEEKKKANFALGDAAQARAEDKLFTSSMQKLEEQLGTLNHQTELQKIEYETTTGSLKHLTAAHKDELIVVAKKIDAKKTEIAVAESLVKAIEAQIAAQQALDTGTNEFFTTHAKLIADMRVEAELVGKTDVVREKALATRKIELEFDKQLGALADNETLSMDERATKTAELITLRDRMVSGITNEIEAKKSAEVLNQRNIEQIQFETTLIGLNTTEREQAIAARALELTGIDKNTEAFKKYVAELNQAIAQKNFAEASKEVLVGMWQDVDRAAHDTFASIFDHGDNAFKRLKDSLKKNLIDILFAMTVRPFLIQIVASTAGTGVAQQVFGNAATLQNGGSGASGLLNLLSSGKSIADLFNGKSTISSVANFLGIGGGGAAAAGIGGSTSLAVGSAIDSGLLFGSGSAAGVGTIGTAFDSLASLGELGSGALSGAVEGGTLFGTLGAEGVGAGATGAAGAAGATSALGALGTALPYIGAAVAVASLLGLFGGSKKIPSRMIDSGGLGFTGEGTQFFSRGSQGAMDISSAVSKGLIAAAASLGAKLPSYGIGFGSNTGHQSQDPNFDLSASVGTGTDYSNQRNVFHSGEDTGQFNKLDQETVALRSAQAMIAILKESDLPKYLKDFFDALKPVSSMSADDVNNALAFAQQLKTAHDLLDKIANLSGIKATADQLIELFGNIQTAVPLLQSYFDNFFTDAEKHTEALKQVTDTMVQLGITTIPKTRAEFRALVEAQDLTTDAGKAMFQSLIAIAPAFAAVTAAIDATAGAVMSLVDRIAQIQTQLTDALGNQISASEKATQSAQDSADAYRQIGRNLAESIRQLRGGDLSPLLPGQKLSESRTNLDEVFQKALSGDKTSLGALPQVAQDFLKASRDYNASSSAYTADFNRVMSMLQQAGTGTDAFAGVMDYQATLLKVQTSVLENIRDELAKPDPSLDFLSQQTSILGTVGDLLKEQTQSLITINSSVLDQTGHVIQGNALVSAQTGEIVAQTTQILGGQYIVTDPQTGQLVLETVKGNMIVDAQTGAVTNVIDQQTGKVIAGNSTSDAIRNLTARDTSLSEEMLRALISTSVTQSSQFGQMVTGLIGVSTLLQQLVALMTQQADVDRQNALAAAAAAATAAIAAAQAAADAAAAAAAAAAQAAIDAANAASVPTTVADSSALDAMRQWYFGPHGSEDMGGQSFNGMTFQEVGAFLAAHSHAGGLASVPYDGYGATLHRDEMVMDAATTSSLRRYGIPVQSGNGIDSQRICDEIRAAGEAAVSAINRASKAAREDVEQQTRELKTAGKNNARESGLAAASAVEVRVRK